MLNFLLNSVVKSTSNDMHVNAAHDWQFGFQTPYSPVMEGIVRFHDDLMIFLTFILFFVLYIMYSCIVNFSTTGVAHNKKEYSAYSSFVHHPTLEIIWTILPALVLVAIAIPSFSLLYSIDEIVEPSFTFKVVGHQWYWSYEIMSGNEFSESILGLGVSPEGYDVDSTSFDSYMLSDDDLDFKKKNHFRLLTVDNHLPLPTNQNIRVLVTAADVLHNWCVPSLGIKLDACPGRLNQTAVFIERPGYYYGQCSELCGVNHGFMPIGIAAINTPGWKFPLSLGEALFLHALREDRQS